MKSAAIKLKDAEKLRIYLLKNEILDKNYKINRDREYVYFPINKEFKFKDVKFVDKTFKKTKEDLKLSVHSYDCVGNIAIFNKEITKKEADEFIKFDKHIKTVLYKVGEYSGEYRTPKLKFISGIDTKETIHNENGIRLKLDVEKCYFSSRTSGERSRIASLVKEGEEVLVMFSGVGPFPIVVSKKSKAKEIYGIELNKIAHNYALKNIKLNKCYNIKLYCGNVREILPEMYKKILGLKSGIGIKQINERLRLNPPIIELYTIKSDFYKDFNKLKKTIEMLQKNGIRVFVHQPMLLDSIFDVVNFDASNEIYTKMLKLIDEYNVELIIHVSNFSPKNTPLNKIIKNIKTFQEYFGKIYFENSIDDAFSDKERIFEIIKKCKITNMCIDVSHFLAKYNNKEIINIIKKIQKSCKIYFHINDYKNKDSCPLNKNSLIKLEKILPYVKQGVIEVRDNDEILAKDMLNSYDYLENFNKKFDRIIIPMPKNAEEFLELASNHIKKNGIIHFYKFLEEKDVKDYNKIIKGKIKNFKILKIIKCGNYSPRINKYCFDIQVK